MIFFFFGQLVTQLSCGKTTLICALVLNLGNAKGSPTYDEVSPPLASAFPLLCSGASICEVTSMLTSRTGEFRFVCLVCNVVPLRSQARYRHGAMSPTAVFTTSSVYPLEYGLPTTSQLRVVATLALLQPIAGIATACTIGSSVSLPGRPTHVQYRRQDVSATPPYGFYPLRHDQDYQLRTTSSMEARSRRILSPPKVTLLHYSCHERIIRTVVAVRTRMPGHLFRLSNLRHAPVAFHGALAALHARSQSSQDAEVSSKVGSLR